MRASQFPETVPHRLKSRPFDQLLPTSARLMCSFAEQDGIMERL